MNATGQPRRQGVSRRGFLQTSAVAGGGLAIGANLAWLSVRQNNWGLRTRRTRAPAVITPKIEPTT